MSDVAAFGIAGLGTGAAYALLGLGILTLYRTTGVLNFGFAAMGMLAAFCYWSLHQAGLAPAPAAAIVIVLAAPAAALVERALVRPFSGVTETHNAVGTIALLVGFIAAVNLVWGTSARSVPDFLPTWHLTVFGVGVPSDRVTTFLAAMLATVVLAAIFSRTRIGIAMRAMAGDRGTAALVGIPVGRLRTAAWAASGVLAALAVLLIAPSRGLDSADLSILVVPGLTAAIIGGLRSPVGVVAGGLLLGVLEGEAENAQWTSDHSQIIAFAVLMVVLVWRQRGATTAELAVGGGRA